MSLENYFAAYRIDDPDSYDHWLSHYLGIALRFVDAFTGRPIDTPLRVSVPTRQWTAVHHATDGTYRFVFTERAVPTGVFTLDIESLTGAYASHQPVQITLPVVSGPPPARTDFIKTVSLWPTRLFKISAAETVIIGRIVSGGANPTGGLQIRIFPQGALPATAPAAFSDPRGEFVYRLPWHGLRMTGTAVNPPPPVNIEISGPGGGIGPVAPATLDPQTGQVHPQTFTIP